MELLPSPMPKLPLKLTIKKFLQSFKSPFISYHVEVSNFYELLLEEFLNFHSVFEQDVRDMASF